MGAGWGWGGRSSRPCFDQRSLRLARHTPKLGAEAGCALLRGWAVGGSWVGEVYGGWVGRAGDAHDAR